MPLATLTEPIEPDMPDGIESTMEIHAVVLMMQVDAVVVMVEVNPMIGMVQVQAIRIAGNIQHRAVDHGQPRRGIDRRPRRQE